jgi:hypothetical protein
VFEKVVIFLDKFYDGDLPLRDESKIISKFTENFSPEKIETNIHKYNNPTAKKSKEIDRVGGLSDVNYEKIKLEILKPRVKDIVTEYPDFAKAKQFFLRMLEVRLNVQR